MSLPRFSVGNPIAANLLMAVCILGGAFFALTRPREFFPQMDPSAVTISVIFPGSTPVEVEKGAIIKIEEAIQALKGIKRIRSYSFEGGGRISVEFETGTDIDQAVNDIKAEVDRLQNLPQEAEKTQIRKVEMIMPVISVVIYGDATERSLKTIAERIRDELLEEEGITQVQITGARQPEVAVEVDPARLEKYGVTFQEVARQVGSHNLDLPGGEIQAAAGDIRLRTLGEENQIHRLEEVILRGGDEGQVVRLRDVASVTDGFKETVMRGRYMGKPAVDLVVSKTGDQDAVKLARNVEAFVARKQPEFQGPIRLATHNNTARFIEMRLGLLVKNAGFGLILVFLSLTLFLNFRVAFWAAMGVPVAILGAFVVMRIVGYTTNLVTLFGLIVILGMVVDDAIVIGENIYRRFQEGMPAREACIRGAEEVSAPVLATVLTTVAAFAPLAFMRGQVGEMFRPIAGTVIAALLVSLLEAFVVLPAHLAGALGRLEKSPPRAGPRPGRAPQARGGSWAARGAELREKVIGAGLTRVYVRLLDKVIPWRYVSVTVALGGLGLTIVAMLNDRPPLVMMQKLDSDMISADLEMAAGQPVERTLAALQEIEEAALNLPEALAVSSVLGQQVAMSPMAGMTQRTADPATLGQVFLELQPSEARTRHSDAILAELRSKVKVIPGVSSLKFTTIDGTPPGADFEIRVRGEDLATLTRAVEHVKALLREYEGAADIRDNMSAGKLEARVELGPLARLAGVTVRDLAMQMRSAVFGAEAQTLQRGREEVEVQVRLRREARDSLGDIERLRVATPAGGRVPFTELATLSTGRGYDQIARIDRKRAVTIEADHDPARTATPSHLITAELERRLRSLPTLFPGVTVRFGGEREEMNRSFGSLRGGFLFALLAIYAILAIIFQSYVQPIIIMLAVPFGLIGAVAGHLLMGFPITMLSWFGLVALTGVVVNDSLILVDFINRGRRAGLGVREAILEGGRVRLRPILLTSITTICGLAPLMAEKSFQAQVLIPMAVSLAFGLAFATLLTLLVLPCLYYILHDAHRAARGLWTGVWEEPELAPAAEPRAGS